MKSGGKHPGIIGIAWTVSYFAYVAFVACAVLFVKAKTERRLKEIEEHVKWRIDQGVFD